MSQYTRSRILGSSHCSGQFGVMYSILFCQAFQRLIASSTVSSPSWAEGATLMSVMVDMFVVLFRGQKGSC